MFTGLVEGRGVICEVRAEGPAVRIAVEPPTDMLAEANDDAACRVGDSVAVNGCCLTAVEVQDRLWAFEAGPETLAKTNLGLLKAGDPVNLERSLPVSARLGGHFVQGHVDGVGEVESVRQDGQWVTMWFRVPPSLTRQMVTKGSIAVDGVSLTLVDVEPERFSTALIPHTLQVTTLGVRRPGDAVNIETDILGKYVLKFLQSADTP